MSAVLLAQQILNGLLDGVYYLLIALGLSLIFSLGGIVNLAHGAFYAIGAYLTLVLSPYLGFGGSFVAAPVVVALLGVVIERTLFSRFYRSDPILSLLMTFGLAMVAEQALRMIFGAPPLSYSIPQWLRGQVAMGSFIYSFYRVVLLGIAATCIAGLWLLLQKTSFGRVVRAGVQNPDMVGALGISLQPYMSAVAALGIGLAGLAGVLLAPIYSIHPAMGQEIITPAFVVVVIGGLGSFWGVVAAALLVGLVKGVMVGIGYSAASTAAIYLLMLLVLLFRPRGLSANASHGSSEALEMLKRLPVPLLIAALGLLVLPPVLLALGLTMTSATEVVTYALAINGTQASNTPQHRDVTVSNSGLGLGAATAPAIPAIRRRRRTRCARWAPPTGSTARWSRNPASTTGRSRHGCSPRRCRGWPARSTPPATRWCRCRRPARTLSAAAADPARTASRPAHRPPDADRRCQFRAYCEAMRRRRERTPVPAPNTEPAAESSPRNRPGDPPALGRLYTACRGHRLHRRRSAHLRVGAREDRDPLRHRAGARRTGRRDTGGPQRRGAVRGPAESRRRTARSRSGPRCDDPKGAGNA